MCGICGIIDLGGGEIPEAALIGVRDALTHRGPDDAGLFRAAGVGLGARRLAIQDLSPNAHMPMTDEETGVSLVHNGEIYNFEELRAELARRGHPFRSSGDTEVLLRAYLEWGPACCERFEGMFAFALWDPRQRQLFAARDRLGVKPFFFTEQDGRFAFASEVHALYPLVGPSADSIDPASLDFYLAFGYLPPDRCFVSGIQKLPPGHHMVLDEKGLRTQRYWELAFEPDRSIDLVQALGEWDDLFRGAVRKRLRSDVALGCFLSGGIDSGLVTAVAAQESGAPLHTFSVGFGGGESHDERPLARQVAERYGTVHTELTVDPTDRSALPRVLHNLGEPFADVGCLPMAQISRAAREHITVAISGDGGDESFGGYGNVLAARRAQRFREATPTWLRRVLTGATGLARAVPVAGRAHRFLTGYVDAPLHRHFTFFDHFGPEQRRRLYAKGFGSEVDTDGTDDLVRAFLPVRPGLEDAERHLHTDLLLRLAGDYLPKVDVASSAFSLEVRSPFLDHRVVEWAARLPLDTKLAGGAPKGLLRRYAEGLLPPDLVHAPKQGFAPDVDAWLRGEWASWAIQMSQESRAVEAGLFDAGSVRTLVEDHVAGRARNGQRIFNLIALDSWWRIFVTKEDPLH